MQQIEKALNRVIVDGVADNYVYPAGEQINDVFNIGNSFANPYFGQEPKNVKFMFGTQKELNIWLKDTNDKYPVVWLVYPLKESSNNDSSDLYIYPKARLIFAINNQADKLVNTRVQTTRFVLDQIVEKFKLLMRTSQYRKFIYIDKQSKIEEEFYPNYSVNKQVEGGNVDVWDAITLDCDLHLISKCIPKN